MMLDLSQSQTWSVQVGSAGIEVQVRSGEVWLTRERDPEDHVLTASQVLDSRSKGKLVIFALTPARVEVTPLAHGHLHAGHLAHAA